MSSTPAELAAKRDGMKMAELSRVSGVPVASIKFYLREGLLPPGRRDGPTQSRYRDMHVRRLRLIRALRDVGRVRVEGIRAICAALDGPAPDQVAVLGCIADALAVPGESRPADDAAFRRAATDLDAYLAEAELPCRAGSSAREQLIAALVALRQHIHPRLPAATFAPYVAALRPLAQWEVGAARRPATMGMRHDDGAQLEAAVYGTVLFEPVLLALRRMLHEHYSAEAGQHSETENR